MIHGFKGKSVITAEEWLIDYSLRTGNAVNVNANLLGMLIKFDGKEVDAFILDVIDNKLILQLVLPIEEKFDDELNVYKTSYIRKLLNSDEFLSRFNKEFIEHVKPTIVHTEDYVTNDKLWLLSHEEVDLNVGFLKPNGKCRSFDLFEHTDLQSYSKMLLKLNKQQCYSWSLRSAYSSTSNYSNSRFVGYVDQTGYVNYGDASRSYSRGPLPACAIC